MRDNFVSNCEKNFVLKLVSEGHDGSKRAKVLAPETNEHNERCMNVEEARERLDGRSYNESRKLEISFGSAYGSCLVVLGETKVLAQVTCEVVQPKQIRPNEGILYINLEVGPMAGPQFEPNRQTDLMVYLNRLLEKCYKDSKCIDLESLCIAVEEKVWSLRVDLKVLNHDGNLIECASIATLASLAHFKRPDVTRSGDIITIHTLAEKDPIPTVLYHYPVCLTYAIFGNDTLLSDPSFIEESVCMSGTEEGINTGGGLLVVGMNQYKELCLLDLTGAACHSANLVHRATAVTAKRCKEVVDLIKSSIVSDDNLRQKRTRINFASTISEKHMLSLASKDLSICLKSYKAQDLKKEGEDSDAEMIEDDDEEKSWMKVEKKSVKEFSKYDVKPTMKNTVETVTNQTSSWIDVSSDSDDDDVIITS